MGVLLPNYPEENVVKGENVPNLSLIHLPVTGTSSSVFQILQDLQLKQYQESHPDSMQIESRHLIPVHTVHLQRTWQI